MRGQVGPSAGNLGEIQIMQRFITYILLTLGTPATMPFFAATMDSHGKAFPTATAAAKALVEAAKSDNTVELIAILGPTAKDIVTTRDPVQDRKARREFVERVTQRMQVVPSRGRSNEMTMLVGHGNWPLPIPIVEVNGKWYFDMARGRKAILMRRVGSNELDAMEVCRGYVEAQNQYAEDHRTAQGVPYYAQRMISSPGEHDGLYWKGARQDESPIGEVIARAIAEGYTKQGEPYHGYFYRVLSGEQMDPSATPVTYIDNGVMTGGFALLAWPAQYGVTGVMTFIVNKSGIVYQKDLGPQTPALVSGISNYEAGPTWAPVSSGVAALKNIK
jgi:hypothetical protein